MLERRDFALPKSAKYDVPEPVAIWPEGIDGEAWSKEELEERSEDVYFRSFQKVSVPGLYCFPAPKENNIGKAVLICPGGAYVHLAIDHEGYDVARFLNYIGISAFVLKYRDPAPNEKLGTYPDGPLQDALRAMRLIRSWSGKYSYASDKIGVMGFSAGGHLCCCVSTMFERFADTNPDLANISARPDFSMPIYPLTTYIGRYSYNYSAIRMLGENCTLEQRKYYSPVEFITKGTPPTFIVHGDGDTGVHPFNSLEYYQRLHDAGVSAELHIFAKAGHGFGMLNTNNGTPVSHWIDLLANWLKEI